MISLNDFRFNEVPESLRAVAVAALHKADISVAGTQLARMRNEARTRAPRVYTGRVFGHRAWRGMRVVLPNGHVGNLYRAVRGAAAVTWRDEFALQPEQCAAVDIAELRPFKMPAAVILGRTKRGVRERRSLKKARAARRNGCQLPRPGSRPRGRPRKPAESPSVGKLIPGMKTGGWQATTPSRQPARSSFIG